MDSRRTYTKRDLTQIFQDRAQLQKELVELVHQATASIARHNEETYGLEGFQTRDVAAWINRRPDGQRWSELGRNALVQAIRQNGWTARKLRPVCGLPMLLWVRGESR